MRQLAFLVVLLSLVGCYVKGYVKVTAPAITSVRWGPAKTQIGYSVASRASVNGAYRVVLTLSNPEAHSVKMVVNCYSKYTTGEDSKPLSKTVTLEPRSDKDVSIYTMGPVECEAFVVD